MDHQLRATRNWLQKQFKTSGIQLDPKALDRLVIAAQDAADPEQLVHGIIDEIETSERPLSHHLILRAALACSPKLTTCLHVFLGCEYRKISDEVVERLLSDLLGKDQEDDVIQVIDAFDTPLVLYDPVRKIFFKSEEGRHVHADGKVRSQAGSVLWSRCGNALQEAGDELRSLE
jgi:hypothetical protein